MMLPNRNTLTTIQQIKAVPRILEMLGYAFESSHKGHPNGLVEISYDSAMEQIESKAHSVHNMYDGGPNGTYWLCMPLTSCGWSK